MRRLGDAGAAGVGAKGRIGGGCVSAPNRIPLSLLRRGSRRRRGSHFCCWSGEQRSSPRQRPSRRGPRGWRHDGLPPAVSAAWRRRMSCKGWARAASGWSCWHAEHAARTMPRYPRTLRRPVESQCWSSRPASQLEQWGQSGFIGGRTSAGSRPSSYSPMLHRQKSAGGGWIGAIAPSRNNCSSREPLKMPCAPPSVSADPGDPADRLAHHVFCAIQRRGCLRRRSLRVAEPGRAIGDQPRRLQIGAQFGNVATHIRMVGERLRVAVRLARMHRPGAARRTPRRRCRDTPPYTSPRTS